MTEKTNGTNERKCDEGRYSGKKTHTLIQIEGKRKNEKGDI